jgi:hypothetical protein
LVGRRYDDGGQTSVVDRSQESRHGRDRALRGKPNDRTKQQDAWDEVHAHRNVAARALRHVRKLVASLEGSRRTVEERAFEREKLPFGPRERSLEVRDVDTTETTANLESIEPARLPLDDGDSGGPHRAIQAQGVRDVCPDLEPRGATANLLHDRDRSHRRRYRFVPGSDVAPTKPPK